MEYKIIEAHNVIELTLDVQESIKKGWQPKGGICYKQMYPGSLDAFYQAMIRTTKK